jgi:microcystin-dependent protein
MRRFMSTTALASALLFSSAGLAFAQEMYLGEVRMFAYNWCPTGWLPANGQLVNISANAALFSLLGVSFGGNGTTNFALPNLQGRSPNGFGPPPAQPFGAPYGSETVKLPAHNHPFMGSSAAPTVNSTAGAIDGTWPAGQKIYAASGSPADTRMNAGSVGMTGGNQPVPTQSPALAMNWCIATTGIYPSRP